MQLSSLVKLQRKKQDFKIYKIKMPLSSYNYLIMASLFYINKFSVIGIYLQNNANNYLNFV